MSCRSQACSRGPDVRPRAVREAVLGRAIRSVATALPDEVAVEDSCLVKLLRSRRRLSLARPTLRRDGEGFHRRLGTGAAQDEDGVVVDDRSEAPSGMGHSGQSCPDSVSQAVDFAGCTTVGQASQNVDIAGVSCHLNRGEQI